MSVEKKKHKLFSSSGMDRTMNCAASTMYCKDMPDSESAASLRGSAGHWLSEVAYDVSTLPTELNIMGVKPPDKRYPKLVDDLLREHCDEYITRLWALEKKLKAKAMIEVKCPLTHIHPDAGGTSDNVILQEWGDLHVGDLKLGNGWVDAKDNAQGACYLVGAAEKFSWDFGDAYFRIFQPTRNNFDVWKLTKKELRGWETKIKKAIDAALKPNAPFTPGDWCHFCKGKLTCPALNKSVAVVEKLPPSKELTLERMAKLLDSEKQVMAYFSELKKRALERLEKGEKIPGWKLVDKRGVRTWTDPKKLEKFLNSRYESDDLYDTKLKSPAQMEKVIGKKLVEKHSVYVSSGNTMAPVKDRRAITTSKVEKDFEDFEL